MKSPKCSVPDCQHDATVQVRLYVVYPDGTVFNEEDHTCPFMCRDHVQENELRARGERKGRAVVTYPYSNQNDALGFTIYLPFSEHG